MLRPLSYLAVLLFVLLAPALLLASTPAGRLYRLALGCVALVLLLLAAALSLRSLPGRWRRFIPVRWLQRRHVVLGCLFVPPALAHAGPGWPASPWNRLLMACFALVVGSGVLIWFLSRVRGAASFVRKNIKPKPDLSPQQQDALDAGQTLTDSRDTQLLIHRTLTFALLVLVLGHVVVHLLF